MKKKLEIDEMLSRLVDLEAADPDCFTEEWLAQAVKARVRMLWAPNC